MNRALATLTPHHDRATDMIELPVILSYLKGEPIEMVSLTTREAVDLATNLLKAVSHSLDGAA